MLIIITWKLNISGTRRDLKTRFTRDLQAIIPEELKNGDIVVHFEHGVGQYEGLCSLKLNGISQDFILILYQDNDKLYLPVDRIEMIGKYMGVDGYTPILDKIGSKAWIKSKAKAKEEVEKLAADLLNLYAQRKVNKGFAFSRPDNYYNDFEAAFAYEETRDQLKVIDDVLLDMESSVPMDRLVCGDVGYGKTEVAVRAAFKAVNDGKQVAVVVPTTILAEQHLLTFRDRFENYPVNIECLSRFRNRKEQKEILKAMSTGRVDIVIGTHRLLQKDIGFKSLGLLVIDEEQRFGVKHKEVLKKKRTSVDVLALTATPIPRTLHMSLTGMRDISIISTPPADRQPIISYISPYEDSIVKDAISRELSRKGQIFFVHNNISITCIINRILYLRIIRAAVIIHRYRRCRCHRDRNQNQYKYQTNLCYVSIHLLSPRIFPITTAPDPNSDASTNKSPDGIIAGTSIGAVGITAAPLDSSVPARCCILMYWNCIHNLIRAVRRVLRFAMD